ncbi:MAG: hypothetical protein Q8M02_00410 [Candidatus Didemnitutus sp.]|nr:hypothetical protein [Candidatus Didemnitutus sp.]
MNLRNTMAWVMMAACGVLHAQAPTPAATTPDAAPVSAMVESTPDAVPAATPEGTPEIAPVKVWPTRAKKAVAYVIPVQEQIGKPTFYIIRRGLKEAIAQNADVVILDMKTPGGALDSTFEIMEALTKFPGHTVTFVDDQAISAGAFISATTEEIWFSPRGKIGAAAPVNATGQDIDKTMRQKLISFLRAEVRSVSEGKGYRGQVISAMIDEDYELKIGDTVLKPKGELLTLIASEAMQTYGEPPQPLLGAGIAKNIDDLLTQKYGAENFEIKQFRVTWSESLAQYLTAFAPVLMGLGMLALFIEFKTPGFGFPGIAGLTLLAIVFFGHYIAGLSGHEPAIVFTLGLLLLALEIFVFPGAVLPALAGVGMILASLLWAMADIWPNQPIKFSGEIFLQPAINLGLALAITAVSAALVVRYLPRTWFWDRIVLATAVDAKSTDRAHAMETAHSLVGCEGVAISGMFPSGEVEVNGQRFQARLELGSVEPGMPIVVTGQTDFGLIVERKLT